MFNLQINGSNLVITNDLVGQTVDTNFQTLTYPAKTVYFQIVNGIAFLTAAGTPDNYLWSAPVSQLKNGTSVPFSEAGLLQFGVANLGESGVSVNYGPNGTVINVLNQDNTASSSFGSRIMYPEKIKRMLAAVAQGRTRRGNIGVHGMSIDFGVGCDDAATYFGAAAGRTQSLVSIMGQVVNGLVGGVWTPGADVISNNTSTFSVSGGASFSALYTSAGPSGATGLPGAAGIIQFVVTGGAAGQVIRVYAYVSTINAVSALYNLSGANTATGAAATISNPTAPNVFPDGAQHWYEYNITLTNAGTTTVQLLNPASGGNLVIQAVDLNYLPNTGGVSFHRLSRSSQGLATLCAWALDGTDTQPVGNWVGNTSTQANRRLAHLTSMNTRFALDGAICSTSVNDIMLSITYGWTLDDHRRHATNYVNGMNSIGVPVLFMEGHLRDPAMYAALPYTQRDIINVYKEVAKASPTVCGAAVLDFSDRLTGATIAEQYAEQWADPTFRLAAEMSQPLHPNRPGHALYGNTGGVSLVSAGWAI